MRPRINLLPLAYREARRRRRRIRAAVVVGGLLLAGEMVVALAVHLRASDTRSLLAAAAEARQATTSVTKKTEQPKREFELLARQVALAERLRAKHYWSRLLGAIGRATPENVVLSAISTDPPQWVPSLRRTAQPGTATKTETRKVVEGITIMGHAAEHGDVSALVSAMYGSGVFERIELRQARRDSSQGREAIAFELSCRW